MNRRGFLKVLLATPAVITVPSLAAKPWWEDVVVVEEILPAVTCEVGIIEGVRFVEVPDVMIMIQQYGCLYAFTDKTHELYGADGRPKRVKQSGYRAAKSWQRAQ